MKFRKKPVVIHAVQWDGGNAIDLMRWVNAVSEKGATMHFSGTQVVIPTLEGSMCGDIGDWIICGVKGEFYPCKPDIFAATYDPVTEEPAA
jgi:hypothetical protein